MGEKTEPDLRIENRAEPETNELTAGLGLAEGGTDWEHKGMEQYQTLIDANDKLKRRVNDHTSELQAALTELRRETEERRRLEAELRVREEQLEYQARSQEQVNIALKVLMDGRERDKKDIEKRILVSLESLVAPHLETMESARMGESFRAKLETVKNNLNNIMSGLAEGSFLLRSKLTFTELQVADQIKKGRTSKEIAAILNVSVPTVSFHRRNIREKLGLNNKKINLRKYLRTHA